MTGDHVLAQGLQPCPDRFCPAGAGVGDPQARDQVHGAFGVASGERVADRLL